MSTVDVKTQAISSVEDPVHQIALVTGGNRGIGTAIVRGLAKHKNLTVIFTARKQEEGTAALKIFHAEGLSNVDLVLLDQTDDKSVKAAAESVLGKYKRVDILVNNAGTVDHARDGVPTWKAGIDVVQETHNINVLGPLRLVQAFVPTMIANNFGRIVNVSSGAGQLGDTSTGGCLIGYRSSKSALNQITKTLQLDLKDYNILVNSMCPSSCDTRLSPYDIPGYTKRTVEEGADTILWLATLPSGKDSPRGGFFRDRKPIAW
jgi:NAD(P)-dependent dehydrogenase (short-subunit alcohol dehydrogenase family)